ARNRVGQGAGSGCFRPTGGRQCAILRTLRFAVAKLVADGGRTAFLTISDPWRGGHARFADPYARQSLTILRGMQSQPKERGKPMEENYLRLIQALFRGKSIRLVSHAMHPRASSGD